MAAQIRPFRARAAPRAEPLGSSEQSGMLGSAGTGETRYIGGQQEVNVTGFVVLDGWRGGVENPSQGRLETRHTGVLATHVSVRFRPETDDPWMS